MQLLPVVTHKQLKWEVGADSDDVKFCFWPLILFSRVGLALIPPTDKSRSHRESLSGNSLRRSRLIFPCERLGVGQDANWEQTRLRSDFVTRFWDQILWPEFETKFWAEIFFGTSQGESRLQACALSLSPAAFSAGNGWKQNLVLKGFGVGQNANTQAGAALEENPSWDVTAQLKAAGLSRFWREKVFWRRAEC